MIKLVLIKKGQRADIYSVIKKEDSIYELFFKGLEEKEQKKINALINFILDKGFLINKQKYELVKPDIVELKISNYRLLAYRENDHKQEKYFYYILDGFKKPGGKAKGRKKQSRFINAAYRKGLKLKAGLATIINNTKGGI